MSSSERNQPDAARRPEDERDEEETQRLITDALGTYSADGQADDATGGDAGAEAAFGHEAHPRGVKPNPASPDGPRIGPS
jgi:hypothetical protein